MKNFEFKRCRPYGTQRERDTNLDRYEYFIILIFSSRSFYLPTCTPVATYLLRPQPPKELLQTVSYIVIITAIYW